MPISSYLFCRRQGLRSRFRGILGHRFRSACFGARFAATFCEVSQCLRALSSILALWIPLKLHEEGGRLTIHAPSVTPHLAVANSIAVNGCCLTVVALENERFSADLSAETIRKTSMGEWKAGLRVNLEQPMTAGKEFGGHFVLGHVDTIGRVARLEPEGENWWYGVEVPESFATFDRSARIDCD